jgi:hypothetical protein
MRTRINVSIRRWSGRELTITALIAVVAVALLLTAPSPVSAPLLGRWLAASVVVLWLCAAWTWHFGHGRLDGL